MMMKIDGIRQINVEYKHLSFNLHTNMEIGNRYMFFYRANKGGVRLNKYLEYREKKKIHAFMNKIKKRIFFCLIIELFLQ